MPFETHNNPLLDFSDTARFDAIKPEHVTPAVDALLADCRKVVATTTHAPAPSWDSVVDPLDDATEKLGRAWGTVGHLHAVVDTPALRWG